MVDLAFQDMTVNASASLQFRNPGSRTPDPRTPLWRIVFINQD